ncbi:MAG: hypothetical protein ACI87E_001361 [Mariniblastus sp.]|jgi:hypothetical protein
MNSTTTIKGLVLALFCFTGLNGFASAQEMPKPSPEHQILQKEVGEWTAEIKIWGPGADEPWTSKGSDSTQMLGEMWSVTEFKGDFFGMEAKGRGTFGFDPAKKKFAGTWVDSMSPYLTTMEGTYDKKTTTMTWVTLGTDQATGKLQKGKNVVKYIGTDQRVMTMYMELAGMDEMFKTLEITYQRKK